MKIKNYGILKTLAKIQFHHKTLNLININLLTIWQVSFQWNWAWTWMWPQPTTLRFNF